MNKIFKSIVIVVVVGGFLFGFYYLFMRPTGFTTQEDVVSSFVESMNETDCSIHFTEETTDICTTFVGLFDDVAFTTTNMEAGTTSVDVTFVVGDVEEVFTFHVVVVEPSGLRGILTKYYYLIDYVD